MRPPPASFAGALAAVPLCAAAVTGGAQTTPEAADLLLWFERGGRAGVALGLEGFPLSGPDPGATALHLVAAHADRPEIVAAVLAAGGDLRARDAAGRTPLHYAAASNPSLQILAALIAAGAPLESRDAQGRTPLHLAAAPATAAALLRAGADPCATDGAGAPALGASRLAGLRAEPRDVADVLARAVLDCAAR